MVQGARRALLAGANVSLAAPVPPVNQTSPVIAPPRPCSYTAPVTPFLAHLEEFSRLFTRAGVRFAITGGMACVRYGLQQTTKDSDWIVAPETLGAVCGVLKELESRAPPAEVSYRSVFGAPLDPRWHRGGWTSHLAVRLDPAGLPLHLDFFGSPPRAAAWAADPEDPAYADRATVARMKKTDRDRDWPMADGLALQQIALGDPDGLLHLQSAELLRKAWGQTSHAAREAAAARRPLLRMVDSEPDDLRLEAAIRAERLIWECVNRERCHLYQREWKAFFRRWQEQPGWRWPVSESFAAQHARLVAAAEACQLPCSPLDEGEGRPGLLRRAAARAAVLANLDPARIEALTPPLSELLP